MLQEHAYLPLDPQGPAWAAAPSGEYAPVDVRGSIGKLIAGRYRLTLRLGRGGHGEVWEAEDPLTDVSVAVKLLFGGFGTDSARVRREVSVLRLLRLPGVVRLLDEGTDAGCPFVVMERLSGAPFPGPSVASPAPWQAVAGMTVATLETLSRIHAAGVIHRDLKPANVLVDPSGRPTILDFGLSFGGLLGADAPEHAVVGTPAYLAPEQWRGDPVTPATDLYALGVLLYEVLAGRLPHDGEDFHEFMAARLTQRPVPLGKLAPKVPDAVASVVDHLLEIDADDRPRSVADVLRMLRGQPLGALPTFTLPRLGGSTPVEVLVEAARQGRSVDLIGPPGSGRSRCLHEAAAELKREGRRVIRLMPADRPFACLKPVVATATGTWAWTYRLKQVARNVDERLRAALAAGTVVVVDDAERLDRQSAAALDRCQSAGTVLRVVSHPAAEPRSGVDTVVLTDLDEAALRPLFAGSDRLIHLRTDAARALWTRTEGNPARVADEVAGWVRVGIARWDETLLRIDRDAIDRLNAGLGMTSPFSACAQGAAIASISPFLQELLVGISLTWPHASPELLATVVAQPVWTIEAGIEELVSNGALRRLPHGRVEPRRAVRSDWQPEQQRKAHRVIAKALPPGSEGRLFHLLCGHDESAESDVCTIAQEAREVARLRAQQGVLGQAVAALREGILAVRRRPDPTSSAGALEEWKLLVLWVEMALFEATPFALDRVLYELCRTVPRTAEVEHLEALVRAALALATGAERALAMADAVAPFADPRLERGRQGIRLLAARRTSQDRVEAVIADAAKWASTTGDPGARAALAGWMGRLRYQQGRFDEAAELHAQAAEGEPWMIPRISAMIYSASSLMEAFRYAEAGELAEKARGLAEHCRHAHYEALAEVLLREVAYRSGTATSVDWELIDAVAQVGVGDSEALLCLNEASILWRAGRWKEAADLAERTYRIWAGMGKHWWAYLTRCLILACGRSSTVGEALVLAEKAFECPIQGLGIQALGLLSRAMPSLRSHWKHAAPLLTASVPRTCWHLRMDVLSVSESLRGLGVASGAVEPMLGGAQRHSGGVERSGRHV